MNGKELFYFDEETVKDENNKDKKIEVKKKATAKAKEFSQNVLLFFDEVNTNYNVNGLLKEILVDRRCMGVKLHDKIRLISACNPYKKALSI